MDILGEMKEKRIIRLDEIAGVIPKLIFRSLMHFSIRAANFIMIKANNLTTKAGKGVESIRIPY